MATHAPFFLVEPLPALSQSVAGATLHAEMDRLIPLMVAFGRHGFGTEAVDETGSITLDESI